MDEEEESRPGFLTRLAADPLRLRRWSWLALATLIAVVIVSRLLSGFAGAMLAALTWIFGPIVALGIGVGDAFFVRHRRAIRRIALTILVSIFAVLTSCVILADISNSSMSPMRDIVVAILYAMLFAGIVIGLAGLIALGIGRGEDYLARRIDHMSGEDW